MPPCWTGATEIEEENTRTFPVFSDWNQRRHQQTHDSGFTAGEMQIRIYAPVSSSCVLLSWLCLPRESEGGDASVVMTLLPLGLNFRSLSPLKRNRELVEQTDPA